MTYAVVSVHTPLAEHRAAVIDSMQPIDILRGTVR